MNAILEIEALHVRFGEAAEPVCGVSLTLERGETHCLVGESGCGKSLTALSVMNLLPRGATRSAEALRFQGQDLLSLSPRRMARLSGDRLAMIFQEPMTSLNPAYTIGSQMTEVLRRHRALSRAAARERAASMLARVGVDPPEHRLAQYPHQLSGGLRQRVMIAMALLCEPELLVADEPTTALDVTAQAQVLRLLAGLKRELGLAVLLITHDLGVVARVADRVSVMYAGEIAESAPVASLFAAPTHPYTKGLLAAVPVPGKVRRGAPLGAIPGTVPRLAPGFVGCAFRDRCAEAIPVCAAAIARQAITEGADAGHEWLCRLPFGWAPRKAA
jgi:peptide/nickel transport system ATP-binding protein